MARIVKDYDERYAEFLDVAQGLFFRNGYKSTSVQDIIQSIGVAKGTFYHYFNSKGEILNAIVQRMSERFIVASEAIADDDSLDALEKFNRLFGNANQWKIENKQIVLETARMMYQDENVLLREKMQQESIKAAAPILAKIIRQGITEGIFNCIYPLETAELVFAMSVIFTQTITLLILDENPPAASLEHIERQLVVYNESIKRVLGMPAETSFSIFDMDDLKAWL